MPSCSSHPDTRFHFGSQTLQKGGWAYSWKLPKGQGMFRISEHIISYMFESYLWIKLTHPMCPHKAEPKWQRRLTSNPMYTGRPHHKTNTHNEQTRVEGIPLSYVPWRPHWKGSLLTLCPEQQNNWWTICRKQISLGLDTVIPYWTMFSEHTDKRTNLWTS